jgi:hypothetical protein
MVAIDHGIIEHPWANAIEGTQSPHPAGGAEFMHSIELLHLSTRHLFILFLNREGSSLSAQAEMAILDHRLHIGFIETKGFEGTSTTGILGDATLEE